MICCSQYVSIVPVDEHGQPLMNMITFSARSREKIIGFHTQIADALEAHDAKTVDTTLAALAAYTNELAQNVINARAAARQAN